LWVDKQNMYAVAADLYWLGEMSRSLRKLHGDEGRTPLCDFPVISPFSRERNKNFIYETISLSDSDTRGV
jgi:hypothetical protein